MCTTCFNNLFSGYDALRVVPRVQGTRQLHMCWIFTLISSRSQSCKVLYNVTLWYRVFHPLACIWSSLMRHVICSPTLGLPLLFQSGGCVGGLILLWYCGSYSVPLPTQHTSDQGWQYSQNVNRLEVQQLKSIIMECAKFPFGLMECRVGINGDVKHRRYAPVSFSKIILTI